MGGGGGDSGPQVTETNPWAPAGDKGKEILDLAKQLFEQQGGIGGNWIDFVGPGANENMTAVWDKLAQSGALNEAADKYGQIGDALTGQLGGALEALKKGSQDITTYDIQSTRDTFLKDKEKFLTENEAAITSQLEDSIASSSGQIYGAAAGGGNVGSSRTQLAQGEAMGTLSSNAQKLMAEQRSQAYDQALAQANSQLTQNRNQQLQAAQQGMGMVQAGMGAYGQQTTAAQQAMQNQLTAGLQQYQLAMQQAQINYQNLMGQQNAGWSNLGMYNQIVGGWAGAGGTSTTTGGGGGGNSFMGTVGALGGAAIGGFFGGTAGAGLGMGLGQSVGNSFSDIRLKENIKVIGYDEYLELPVYSWDWNEEGLELPDYKRTRDVGFIAQEVMEKYPSAVKTDDETGYLMIHYGMLGR